MRKLNLRKVVGIECINMIDVFNGREKIFDMGIRVG